jgi:hypothetical protein
MPAKPAWYGRLDHILEALRALPRPYVDRATVESLLGVGRRRAQQIMAPCITDHVGSNGLADRDRLLAHLRSLGDGTDVHYERQRRRKVASVLERLHQNWTTSPRVLVEAPHRIVNQGFEDLPAGIVVTTGRITVEFTSSQEALEKLLALAMAIGNQLEAFDRLTTLE